MFGAREASSVSLLESHIGDLSQVSPQENSELTSAFTEKEVLDAISQMEHVTPRRYPNSFSPLLACFSFLLHCIVFRIIVHLNT